MRRPPKAGQMLSGTVLKPLLPLDGAGPGRRKLLHQLVETALPMKKLLNWHSPALSQMIFDDFLGDVHLYGDFARTRGRAVRHFHVILDEIHLRDLIEWGKNNQDKGGVATYQPPTYSVIAHSLGSILSFDALVYAQAERSLREAKASTDHPSPSLPFLGYVDPAEGENITWASLIEQLSGLEGHHRFKAGVHSGMGGPEKGHDPTLKMAGSYSKLRHVGLPH